ncbi:hypothetical protein DITRI_Ditri08aG0094300 [Diplodiscus trichospermus]
MVDSIKVFHDRMLAPKVESLLADARSSSFDSLVNAMRFRLGLALTSELPHPNKLLYLAFGFFTKSFWVLKDSYLRGTSTKFLPIPSLAKAQVRRPAMPIPPTISSIFSSKLAKSFPRAKADSVSKREKKKTFDLERLVALLSFQQENRPRNGIQSLKAEGEWISLGASSTRNERRQEVVYIASASRRATTEIAGTPSDAPTSKKEKAFTATFGGLGQRIQGLLGIESILPYQDRLTQIGLQPCY